MAGKRLSEGEWEKREKVGEEYRARLKRLTIKHRKVAEAIGVHPSHFEQMLQGQRKIWDSVDTIELVISEYEEAERRIKEKLYK
jgi:plasmid maintenance system antidote protein VapI